MSSRTCKEAWPWPTLTNGSYSPAPMIILFLVFICLQSRKTLCFSGLGNKNNWMNDNNVKRDTCSRGILNCMSLQSILTREGRGNLRVNKTHFKEGY